MKFCQTELPGVLVLEPTLFKDDRGYFLESWHAMRYQELGLPLFVQCNSARSRYGVLRGLHYQLRNPQGKLVWVSSGEIFDVAIDIQVNSPTFGQWVGKVLSE